MSNVKIGFDIGNSSLKIAVERWGKLEFHEVRMPENMVENGVIAMPNAFADFLRKTRKQLKLPRAKGALVIPLQQAICRKVTMPRMTTDQLMMNLPYEFNDFIQGEPDHYFCDYALCEEAEGAEDGENVQMTLMAAAVAKSQVYEYIRMFSQAGISLKILLPQEMALIELVRNYRYSHKDAPEEYCFVDLGHSSTRIIVVDRDRIQAMRHVRLGMRDLDMVIADQLNIDAFLADSYKRTNYQDILNDPRCIELYNQIAVEILKVINFYFYTDRESRLEGLYLVGGGAYIKPFCSIIQEVLQMPVYEAGSLIPAGEGQEENCSFGIFAAGMALAEEDKK